MIYSTDVHYIASQAIARSQNHQKTNNRKAGTQNGDGENHEHEKEDSRALDAMAALERQARAPVGFVAASTGPQGGNISKPSEAPAAANPDEIDLDDV